MFGEFTAFEVIKTQIIFWECMAIESEKWTFRNNADPRFVRSVGINGTSHAMSVAFFFQKICIKIWPR